MRMKNYRLQWLLENLAAIAAIIIFIIALSGIAKLADMLAEWITK